MRILLGVIVLLGATLTLFQNCADHRFSAAGEFSAAESHADLVVPNIVFENNEETSRKIYTLVLEGQRVQIPFDFTGLTISEVIPAHSNSGVVHTGKSISFPQLNFVDEGVYEIIMSDESRYSLFLAVVPKMSITFQSVNYVVNAGSDTQLRVDFLIPGLPVFLDSFDSQISKQLLSDFNINWFFYDGQSKEEISSSKFNIFSAVADQNNRINGYSVLTLDSVTEGQEGRYEVVITSQVGTVAQSLSNSSNLSVTLPGTNPVQPRDCSINGATIAHGSSRTFYNASISRNCTSQNRVCNDGTLSGNYTQSSCRAPATTPDPVQARDCSINGATIAHGSSRTFYNASISRNCTSQNRVCNDGTLSGNYTRSSCRAPVATPDPEDCTLNGITVRHGAQRYFYSSAEHASCSTNRQLRTCTDGVLSGSSTQFFHGSCRAPAPVAKRVCKALVTDAVFTRGQTIMFHGGRMDFYSSQTSSNCNAIKTTRSCDDGVITGNSAYMYTFCSHVSEPTGGGGSNPDPQPPVGGGGETTCSSTTRTEYKWDGPYQQLCKSGVMGTVSYEMKTNVTTDCNGSKTYSRWILVTGQEAVSRNSRRTNPSNCL